jgi:BarA-like signal transduction histidine kinase
MAGRSVVVLLLVAALAVSCAADIIDDEVIQGVPYAMIGASRLQQHNLMPCRRRPLSVAQNLPYKYLLLSTHIVHRRPTSSYATVGQSIR